MKVTRNELRLGNLLDFEGEVCIVREIDSSGAVVLFNNNEEDWIDLFQFSGIPLTEELLLRFGFAKIEREDEDFIYFKKDNIELCDVSPNGFELVWYELAPCIYVHQLQNIIFALTGEELTPTKTIDPL